MGKEALKRHLRFWLLILLGACIYTPFLLLATMVQMLLASALFLAAFIIYCYLLYRHVYRRVTPNYPIVPPEGRMDIYFPRTDIPRPIHEDIRRYPHFFGRKKKRKPKKAERVERMRRKK